MLAFIASIGSLIPGLFGKQLSYKVAKIAGFAILGVLLLAVLSLGKCAYDASVVNKYKADQQAKVAPAKEKAADQRAEDTITDTKNEEELHHVIDSAPKTGELSPAARALSCERLRRVGRIPAACRSQGGN